MKVHTSDQEKVLERLLAFAGSSDVLALAIDQVKAQKGDAATLADLLVAIREVKSRRSERRLDPQPI